MKKKYPCLCSGKTYSRRNFLTTFGSATAGLFIDLHGISKNLFAATSRHTQENSIQVAATLANTYDQNLIKQKVQHLFEALGGIGDVIKTSDKVAIKINLTGGSSNANHSRLDGVDIRDSVWTNPEVLRAVTELIIDHGVSANNIYFVEAIWDADSYTQFGYQDIQQDLGVQLVDLNNKEPYPDFMDKEVGDNHFYYTTLKFNRILDEVDAFVSIPKMKHHYNAGVTHSMKNLVGTVPLEYYTLPNQTSYRSALHFGGGDIKTHLPRSICDLNMARPIHLAVIDGIKNAEGGEGPWNITFQPSEYHLLLAGKDPVATDSIASLQMGDNPEAEKIQAYSGDSVDNYLYLAHQKGMGTNILSEIEIVGDGADAIIISDITLAQNYIPNRFILFQNYPNPFNSSTTFRYFLPQPGKVTLKVYNTIGQLIKTLVNNYVHAGEHQLNWNADNLPSGMYFYNLRFNQFSETRKLILQR
jgi:uncharacterized protein (DUF362 family)